MTPYPPTDYDDYVHIDVKAYGIPGYLRPISYVRIQKTIFADCLDEVRILIWDRATSCTMDMISVRDIPAFLEKHDLVLL